MRLVWMLSALPGTTAWQSPSAYTGADAADWRCPRRADNRSGRV
jgi:hypothetical protein